MYRKRRLVPFGEFLPFRPLFSWVLNYLNIPMSDFAAWPTAQQPMRLAGQPVGVAICYENEFGTSHQKIIARIDSADQSQRGRVVWQLSGPSSATADGPYESHGKRSSTDQGQ